MAMMVDGKDVVECKDVVDCKMWSIELMVGGKDMVDGIYFVALCDQSARITAPKATADCCVANTIVNCYYWSFEVANVVADGRFSKKTMIMWL